MSNTQYTKQLTKIVSTVTKQLNDLKIGLAAETVHNEFWHWWCDEVLESYKFYGKALDKPSISFKFLEEGMKTWLRLLHPFVPFVTEAAWNELFPGENLLVSQAWPSNEDS